MEIALPSSQLPDLGEEMEVYDQNKLYDMCEIIKKIIVEALCISSSSVCFGVGPEKKAKFYGSYYLVQQLSTCVTNPWGSHARYPAYQIFCFSRGQDTIPILL